MRYFLALLLVGCATQDLVWHKDGAGMDTFDRDGRACAYDGNKAFHADPNSPIRANYTRSEIYKACMRSRGWEQVPRGSK